MANQYLDEKPDAIVGRYSFWVHPPNKSRNYFKVDIYDGHQPGNMTLLELPYEVDGETFEQALQSAIFSAGHQQGQQELRVKIGNYTRALNNL